MKLCRYSLLTISMVNLALSQNQQSTDPARSAGQQSGQSQQSTKDSSKNMDHSKSASVNSSRGMGTDGRAGQTFAMKAAQGGRMEVEMAQQAVEKASNPEVKRFAQQLVEDHTKANDELMQITKGKGMGSDKMKHGANQSGSDHSSTTHADAGGQKNTNENSQASNPSMNGGKMSGMSGKLSGKTGAEFDRAFLKEAISHHEKDVALFEKESTSGSDPELKAFAAKTLPTLRQHLQTARSLGQQK